MARVTKPLSDTEIRKAKPKDKVYNLADGEGLQLRIKPNGSKLWLLDYYRPYTKKRTSLSFGNYPEVSLAQARKKRIAARELLAQDIDPQEHREEQNRAIELAYSNTLENIATHWLQVKKSKVTAEHAADTMRSLELHIFPKLGKLPIHKITAVKAIEAIKPIAAKGSLETVKRLCQRLNEIMIYAVNTGIIEHNPLAGINQAFQAPTKRHLPTLKPEQLPDFMNDLSGASIKLSTRCLLEWQLHTMVRPSEAAGTRWDELDIENALWNIPLDRMKNKKPHTVPLSPQSLALLEVMRPIAWNSEFVFPSDRSPKNHINKSTANMAIKRMGYHGLLVSHGLRAIASTTLNEQGFDADVIEAALAHTGDNEIRNAYNRADYLERRKYLMAWWSDHIEKAAESNNSLSGHKGLKLIANA
jgi:integrase